jgi:hypothetical protein
MDTLVIGWRIALWLIMSGFAFGYASLFLTGLSMTGIIIVIKIFKYLHGG